MAMGLLNKISFPQRLFLWLLVYSGLLVGCFIVFQYHREKEFKAEELNSRLQLINTYILNELAEGNEISEIAYDEMQPFADIRVSVISDKGTVVYDNTLDRLPETNHLDRTEIQQALKKGAGYTVRRHSQSTGNNYFYSAKKGDGYIVRTAVPYSISLSSLLQADYGFLWIMGLTALVFCILGFFATRRVGQHVSRLNKFAQSVENGEIISDTEPFPHDELGEISNNIVRLYAKLQKANAERDREHRAALHEHVEKERIKKQLTNNINHELKTPVASIRLCVETLLAHSNISREKSEQFLQRCLANTDRLQRLLGDVALITRMDEGRESVEKKPVDLAEIVRGVVDDRQVLAGAKGIKIENSLVGPLPMQGNRFLLESVFNNLIDNAIAYSGGTEIRIEPVSVGADRIVLTLADNGMGVASEHLPRLFERFYRIDVGRSRASGGTGLGLAIVKNAVMMHGGSIEVANQAAGGLLFKIVLMKS